MRTGRFTTARLPVAAAIASHRSNSATRQPRLVPNGRLWALLALALALCAGTPSGLAQAQTAPSLYTDRATYVAGDTVVITGQDFSPGEVTLQVTHAGGGDEPGMDHEPQTVTVQGDGTFAASWSPRLTDLSGPDFVVTVVGDPQGDAVPAHFSRVAV